MKQGLGFLFRFLLFLVSFVPLDPLRVRFGGSKPPPYGESPDRSDEVGGADEDSDVDQVLVHFI